MDYPQNIQNLINALKGTRQWTLDQLAALPVGGIGVIRSKDDPVPETDGLYAVAAGVTYRNVQADFAVNTDDPGKSGAAYLKAAPGVVAAPFSLDLSDKDGTLLIATSAAGDFFGELVDPQDSENTVLVMTSDTGAVAYLYDGANVNGTPLNPGWYALDGADAVEVFELIAQVTIRFSALSQQDAETYAGQIAAIFSAAPGFVSLTPGMAELRSGDWTQLFSGVSTNTLIEIEDIRVRLADVEVALSTVFSEADSTAVLNGEEPGGGGETGPQPPPVPDP